MHRIASIVLAAGASIRMGSPKQLLRWNGRTLIENAVRQLQAASLEEIFVVLGASYEPCETALRGAGARIVHNDEWNSGIATSIRAGLNAALASETYDAVLLSLVDQPAIPSTHFEALVRTQRATPHGIAASAYAGTRGVPVIFPQSHFPALLVLDGDQGAKRLIALHADLVTALDCPAAAWDWDLPGDPHITTNKHDE